MRRHHTPPSNGVRARLLSVRAGGTDRGFTMIETIVSFTIFAIVSAAAALSLVTGIDSNTQTSDRVVAAQLAQQATDQARAMPRASLTATPVVTTTQTANKKQYTVTRTAALPGAACASAALPTNDTTVRTITVRVDVTIPGSRRVVRVDSVLAC